MRIRLSSRARARSPMGGLSTSFPDSNHQIEQHSRMRRGVEVIASSEFSIMSGHRALSFCTLFLTLTLYLAASAGHNHLHVVEHFASHR
ncbi:hypothetical protein VTI74DRAFT_10071 [Chaetomium olivicolor]